MGENWSDGVLEWWSNGSSIPDLQAFVWLTLPTLFSVQRFGDYTTEALRSRCKEFLIKKYSELCELCASVVNILQRKLGSSLNSQHSSTPILHYSILKEVL
jgi:hypothetical protein